MNHTFIQNALKEYIENTPALTYTFTNLKTRSFKARNPRTRLTGEIRLTGNDLDRFFRKGQMFKRSGFIVFITSIGKQGNTFVVKYRCDLPAISESAIPSPADTYTYRVPLFER